jgi:hypothetical protein
MLPATYAAAVEAGLVEQALGMIDRSYEWLRRPGRAAFIYELRANMRDGVVAQQHIIAAARNGDLLAHEALKLEFHDMLNRDAMPPVALRAYAAEYDLRPPRRQRGGDGAKNWNEDWGFVTLVGVFAHVSGLEPTRNEATRAARKPSSASVCSTALRLRGYNRATEGRLNKLWSRHVWVWGEGKVGTMGNMLRARLAEFPQLR